MKQECMNCGRLEWEDGELVCKYKRNPKVFNAALDGECPGWKEMDERELRKRRSQLATLERLRKDGQVL